jgi:hypothetical protein
MANISKVNLGKENVMIAVTAFEFGRKRAAIPNHFNADESTHVRQHSFPKFYNETIVVENRLSDNVGGVKYISSARSRSTPKSAISLSLRFCTIPNPKARS